MKNIALFIRQLFCRHHYRYTEINHDGINTVECKRCGKRKIVRVLHLLVLAFMMCGCDKVIDTMSDHRVTEVDYEQDGFPITIIDSCEYIRIYTGHFYEFTHKGNCKYCAERQKKEQEELIYKIKEQ